jgi:hypothetical protein
MNFLLEFKNYDDLKIIQDTIRDVVLSEIEESINSVVHKAVLDVQDGVIVCLDLKRSEFVKHNAQVFSYLISFNRKLTKEEFSEVSKSLENILNYELDYKVKCFFLVKDGVIFPDDQYYNPTNEIIICNEDDLKTLQSIRSFEEEIEYALWEIKDNEYAQTIELTGDSMMTNSGMSTGITIWLTKYLKKLGINLSLNRKSIGKSSVNHEIEIQYLFNSSRNLSGRWLQDIKYDSDGKYKSSTQTDMHLKNWIRDNLPVHYRTLDRLYEIGKKIESLNLSFDLDLESSNEAEAERFVNMIREKVFPLFSDDSSKRLANLYSQFNKLQEFGIDATWTNEGNYSFLFDINYKKNHYIFKVKLILNNINQVEIEWIRYQALKELNIKDTVPINEVANTIFLILQEN